MFSDITAELDDIADTLQKRGFNRLAARTDMISNTLEQYDKRRSSRRPNRRQADSLGSDKGLSMQTTGGETPPGSADADESGQSDRFIAETYHKTPVGKDSVSRMLGAPSPADMLSRLDFADKGVINIQSSRRQAAEGDAFDEGDPVDPWTTAGLPESGDESQETPPDKTQKGDVLPFLGTEEEGSLHMPQGTSGGSESEIESILTEAEEGEMANDDRLLMGKERRSSVRDAHAILEEHARTAADVEVSDPDTLLHHHDAMEDVMVNFPWVDGETDAEPVTSSVPDGKGPGVYANRTIRKKPARR